MVNLKKKVDYSTLRTSQLLELDNSTLTVEEASAYFRIGIKKLRNFVNENKNADWIIWNNRRPQIKRKLFEQYIDTLDFI